MFLLALAAAYGSPVPAEDRAHIARAAAHPAVPARVAELLRLSRGPAAALSRALDALLGDARLPLPARERALMEFVLALREMPATPAALWAVAELSGYQSRVRLPNEEGPGQLQPVYRIATAALGTQRYWARRAVAVEALERMAHREPDALTPAGESVDTRRGLIWAAEAAPAELLRPYAATLAQKARADAAAAPVAAVLARRLADPELFRAVFASGDTLTALRLLPQTAQALAADRALDLLRGIAGNDELRGAAALEMVRIGGDRADVREWLLELLEDPALGGTAAVALARMGGRATTRALVRRLQASRTDAVQARIVLALTRIGSREAVVALQAYLAAGRGPGHLRAEIRRWLADS